jgi:hypothetical protein
MTPPPRDPQQLSAWFSSAAARLGELQDRLTDEVRSLRRRQAELDAREEKLDERDADLQAAHDLGRGLAAAPAARRAALDERESLIAGREEHLAARERELLATRERLDDYAQQIRAAAERTQQRETDLADRTATLSRCEEAISRFQGAFESALKLVRRAPVGADVPAPPPAGRSHDDDGPLARRQAAAPQSRGRAQAPITSPAPAAAQTPEPPARQRGAQRSSTIDAEKPSAIEQIERAVAEMKAAAHDRAPAAAPRSADAPARGLDPLLGIDEMDQVARAQQREAGDTRPSAHPTAPPGW